MPHTLLLADDSVTIQRVIELTFAEEDVQVVAVGDGDQAIARLQSSPPDIVLADIGMPGKNGYEVAQFVRQTPGLAEIPVVLLTGAFEPVDQARVAEAGCDGVLAKPFEPQLVITRVKELLAKRHGASPSQGAAPAAAPWPAPAAVPWPPAAATAAPPAPAPESSALDEYFDRLDAAFAAKHSAADAAITSPGAATPAADIDWFSAANGGAASMDSWDLPAPPAAETPFDPPLTFASPEPPPVSFEAPPPLETAAPFEPPVAVEPPPIEFASPSEVAEFQEAAAFEQPPARDYGDVSHLFETAPQVTAPAASEAAVAPAPPVPSPKQSDPLQEFPAAVEFATAGAAVAPPAPKPSAPPPQLQPAAVSLPPLSDAFAALLAAEAAIGSRQAAIAWPATPPPSAAISDELIEAVARRVLDRLSDRVMRDAVAETVSRIAEQLVRDEIERIKASINK